MQTFSSGFYLQGRSLLFRLATYNKKVYVADHDQDHNDNHADDPDVRRRLLDKIVLDLGRAMCSQLWHCRTYNRAELRQTCAECGLPWQRELSLSGVHRVLKLGGIIVEVRRE
jgi:hypothetical protein